MVFNTCAVTQEAENEAIKAIINHKKKHPDKKIIVTGCAAQINAKKFGNMGEVDLSIGIQSRGRDKSYTFSSTGARTQSYQLLSVLMWHGVNGRQERRVQY